MTSASEPDQPGTPAASPLAGSTLFALVGPTAAGKSRIAMRVAERAGAEIASLDSMQVYRGMDVGTAKPSASERARVRHHMLDLVETDERFDIQHYFSELRRVRAASAARLFFVGGTGFYLKALSSGLFEGPPVDRELRARVESRAAREGNAVLHAELARIDPRAATRIHAHDTKRLVRALEVYEQTGRTLSAWQREWVPGPHAARHLVGLALDVPELDRRIAARARAMLDAGWVEEACAIRAGRGFGPTAIQALGYREVLAFADGTLTRAQCVERIALATRQFARRQRTWYRKFPDVQWIPAPGADAGEAELAACASSVVQAFGW